MQSSEPEQQEPTEQIEIPLRDRITWPHSPTDDKYPYDQWFDGSIWKLKLYEDFFVQPTSLRSALYMSARRRNFRIKTHVPSTNDFLYVQAFKK